MAETMKRWVLEAYGRNHLRLETAPIPRPGPREVLVQARAVSLNYRDLGSEDPSTLESGDESVTVKTQK